MEIITTTNNIYILDVSIKGLVIYNNSDDLCNQLYSLLIKHQPNISLTQCKDIINELGNDYIDLRLKNIYKSFSPILQEDINKMYSEAVGEMGVNPTAFWLMSPDEIDQAYDGYLIDKETTANFILLSLYTHDNKEQVVNVFENKEYSIGSTEDRNKTFFKLGIEGS